MTAVAPLDLIPPEARTVESALTIMSNKTNLDKLHNDIIKIYICSKKFQGNIVMFVTDDHTFFRVFADSSIAENIQHVYRIGKEACKF